MQARFRERVIRFATLSSYFDLAFLAGMVLLGIAMLLFESGKATDDLSMADIYEALFTELHRLGPEGPPDDKYCLRVRENGEYVDADVELLDRLTDSGLRVVPSSECTALERGSYLIHSPSGTGAIQLGVDSVQVGRDSVIGRGYWYENGHKAEGYECAIVPGAQDSLPRVHCEMEWIS